MSGEDAGRGDVPRLEVPDDFYDLSPERRLAMKHGCASGPEPGRCGSCGRFVADGAIICGPCDLSERRQGFYEMMP